MTLRTVCSPEGNVCAFLNTTESLPFFTNDTKSGRTFPQTEMRKCMKKNRLEFRYYEMPAEEYVLAKLGTGWEQEYGVSEEPGLLHFHNYLEIGWCYHGHGTLSFADRQLRYGDAMFTLIPKNVPHTTNSDPGNICKWEFLFIDLDAFVNRELSDWRIRPEELLKRIEGEGILLRQSEHPRLAALLQMIFSECRDESPYYKDALKGYLRVLVIELLRRSSAFPVEEGQRRFNGYISTALQYIATHYAEDIHVSDIAANSGLSESHFRRLFEESTNMKPVDYLNMIRVNKACELMCSEEAPMSEIGQSVGFQTTSSFNRNFKALTNITPLQWKMREMRDGIGLKNYDISAKRGWEALTRKNATKKSDETEELL